MRNNHYWDDEDYKRDHEIKEFERLQKEGDPINFLKHYLDEISFEYFMESIQVVNYFIAGGKDYTYDDYSIKNNKINIYISNADVILNTSRGVRIIYEAGRLHGYDSIYSAECSYELDCKTTYNKFTKVIETINDLSLHEFGKDDYNYEQLSKLDNIITHLYGVSSFTIFNGRGLARSVNLPEVDLRYDGSWSILYAKKTNKSSLYGKNQTITGNICHKNTIFNIKDWMYLQKHPELNGFL